MSDHERKETIGRRGQKANRLVNEKSPYLLQHAYNPVDWYPWGKEATERSKKEKKLIFLSIGYSSCHWCHVMAHESFEDESVAKLLNDNFVSIKVDREERPDLDELYMKAVISLTGSGGWPLSVFLTPDLEPFYGGTYFPPVARYGMPGFSNVLRSISQAWGSEREKILDSASQIKAALEENYLTSTKRDAKIDEHVFDDCYSILAGEFDQEYGGFGSAPKFPTPSNLFFLMRYYSRTREKGPLRMVTKTLDAMSSGGIYDQIGGGFHRYSTDRLWLVPHFEKMLYDNALLALAYTEAYQITKKESYREIVSQTFSWTMSEMRSKEGGFYSAIDADSPEGEGSYYVWNKDDLRAALGNSKSDVDFATSYFSVSEAGNFESGKSILTSPPEAKNSIDQVQLERVRSAMLSFRAKRPGPGKDDKILVGWNGIMISAMCRAYRVFENRTFIDAALNAANFILRHLVIEKGNDTRLIRRYRDGESRGDPVLEDYAFFINALIDLYEATFEIKYVEFSIRLTGQMIRDFYDEKDGAFFMSPAGRSDLIIRAKEANDGAVPSGNSVAALALLRLAELLSNEEYRRKARDTVAAFWGAIENHPASHAYLLTALEFMTGKTKEIVVTGDLGSKQTKDLLRAINEQYLPNSVIALAEQRAESLIPMLEGRIQARGDAPRAFVCSNYACKLPSKTREELLEALDS